MKKIGLFCLAIACVAGLGIVVLLGFSMWASRTTPYWPWGHEFSDCASCVVLDTDGERVLIQHGELSLSVYYLELSDAVGSRFFELPESIGQLAPEGYRAELIPENDSEILLNGEKHRRSPGKGPADRGAEDGTRPAAGRVSPEPGRGVSLENGRGADQGPRMSRRLIIRPQAEAAEFLRKP